MTKLLNKPLKLFVVFSAIVVLASVPIHFYIVDTIWLEELDENNEIIAKKAKYELAHLDYKLHNADSLIAFWNTIQPNCRLIKQVSGIKVLDTVYTKYEAFAYSGYKDLDRFRVWETSVHIDGIPYTLIVASNVEETYETVLIIAGVSVMMIIIIGYGFIMINRQISKRLWQPFHDTLAVMNEFKLEDEHLPEFKNTSIVEFEELHNHLSRLMSKNIDVYRMQKEFTENVSHELQTPLSILQGKLNLMMQSENLGSKMFQMIESSDKALARAIKINKNFLLLAKLDANQFTQKEDISVEKEVRELVNLLENEFHFKSIQLDLDIVPEVTVLSNRDILETLLQNLITNMLRYTPAGGHAALIINQEKMIFTNSGTNQLDQEKMFKRFISMNVKVPNTGIGLALVKGICVHNGWNISYTFKESNCMHVFTVTF